MQQFARRAGPIPLPSVLRAKLIAQASEQERLALAAALSLDLHWEQSYPICTKTGKHYYGDIYQPDMRLCIEIDGRHHDRPFRQKCDAVRDDTLRSLGILTKRIRCPFTYEQVRGEIQAACLRRKRHIAYMIDDGDWRWPVPDIEHWPTWFLDG